MMRRNFLGLFGAAVVAPAMPIAAPAIRANVAGLAAAHAKKYPFVSVMGLSKSIGVTTAQAEQVLYSLSRKGLVGQVQTCASGAVHAGSQVYQPAAATLAKAAQAREARQAAKAQRLAQRQIDRAAMKVDLSDFIAHLRHVCIDNGMTLSPRCFA